MSGLRTIGQVAYRRPLRLCGMEELAARQRDIAPVGGVLFARNADGAEKTKARQMVLDLFTRERWPGFLHMLTMPGLQWRFERKLLAARQEGWMRHRSAHGVYFTACENDRAIFYAAVGEMPGLHTRDSELKRIKPYPFAEFGVKTRFASFFFANVDDLLAQDNWTASWDAVWLDYTGPLTDRRLAMIRGFYQRHVKSILIVTALKSRFNKATTLAVEKAGGYEQWLRKHLDGDVLHYLEYFDTSAMAQFTVRKQ